MARKKKTEFASGEGRLVNVGKTVKSLPTAREPNAERLGPLPLVVESARHALPASPRHSDDPRIQDIMALSRERSFWMGMRMRNTARLAAEVRRLLQPTRAQDETWNEATKSEALKIVQAAVASARWLMETEARALVGKKPRKKPEGTDHSVASAPFLLKTAMSLAGWELEEESVLARMVEIAGTLAIAPFVDCPERKGFTLAGLAVLIGHAGHPLDYPKKGHLWKRLGLAPFSKDGVTRAGSSWGRYGGLSKDDWIELGYKRSRLGDIFGKITQPLLYAQWRATGAIGPYGEAYGRYKAQQVEKNEAGAFAEEAARQAASAKKSGKKPRKELLEGKLTPGQIHERALRYMTKKLIADMWFAWRRLDRLISADKAGVEVSAAATTMDAGKAKGSVPDSAIRFLPIQHPPSLGAAS